MSVKFLEDVLVDGDAEDYGNVVFDSGWISEGKYEVNEIVVEITQAMAGEFVSQGCKPGFYRINQSRSGSYYTDYEYSDPDIEEVEPYEVTVVTRKWRTING